MDVYRGADKVAEFESYDELRVGANMPAFIYEGGELVYPAPVRDGLVLWYDFSGRTNADGQRGIAEDLSGNGNHGTLQNFNYTAESGYDKNGLLFDGVDDEVRPINQSILESSIAYDKSYTLGFTILIESNVEGALFGSMGSTTGRNGAYIEDGLLIFGHYHKDTSWHGNATQNELKTGVIQYLTIVKNGGEFPYNGYSLYVNGIKEDVVNNSIYFLGSGFKIGRLDSGLSERKDRYLDGNIYSTQIYNRPLTPEEIKHNYAIEKERFGIE